MKLKKSNKELFILIFLLIIGSGILYYKFILSSQIEQIKQLDEDIKAVSEEIEIKEKELENIDVIKERIEQTEAELNKSRIKILPYSETAKKLISIQDYIKLNALGLEKIELNEPVEKIIEEESQYKYGEVAITLEVFGNYEDLKTFVEQLKSSIKFFTIRKIEISPKEDSEYVQANIDLYTYTVLNNDNKENNISNYNFMEYDYEYKNPFKTISSLGEEQENVSYVEGILEKDIYAENSDNTEENNLIEASFKIAIKDAYASGDNFYIVGPGDVGEYTTVQTKTTKPVDFYLKVNPTGYEYAIEAEDEARKSYKKEMFIDKGRLVVDSTVVSIKKNQELKTNIYIQNNTENILPVEIKGNFKDRIYIYTYNGSPIKPGETKENIKVMIS
ncbi:type 4a pilus biogenesis protein PilO [Defluviitalea phaphyphila]|uniref:type 4a pilus biogenesis protein PilO n=1 Tax=Defluviitalea phaphyphila TaxID=1473580 RepID=UPI000730D93F|nr:type 4a pilus biogenesis protein PilO [Defluviitalea phaphyphila]